MIEVLKQIKRKLIVSCQAEGDSPFNSADGVSRFAICAEMGGASAIRSEGVEKTKKIIESVSLPVIGLKKSSFPGGYVRITGSFDEVEAIISTGCDIIAVDGTFREREGLTGPDFIRQIKRKYNIPVMADIATKEEAKACADQGADCISTTLNGYTPETERKAKNGPDFSLLKTLVDYFKDTLPVIAEGRYNSPGLAKQAIEQGAWAVVVGTAITRPHVVTQWFKEALEAH
ncbi:MAG: N-acetylmannosamine-6-phosphate 2-epimerase [Bacteroidales bacterium]